MKHNDDLKQWVAQQLTAEPDQLDWQPLLGDASFRRYTRCIYEGVSYVAAYAPPETEKNHEFVAIAALLKQAQIKAPEVLAVDYQRGFLLQSDLGTVDLQSVLDASNVDALYGKAMQQIQQMQTISSADLPLYDEQLLAFELSLFNEWFVQGLLAYQCTAAEEQMLAETFQQLIQQALAQPQAFVHRDYHCRNILLDGEELACIDFQDAVIGPITYDLVSLLRDCYVVWPQESIDTWLQNYRQQHCPQIPLAQFTQWFDYMGLQRHIKVLGVFARLFIRDGKDRYLADLATVINYTVKVAEQYTELAEFCAWFKVKLLPLAKQQAWGQAL